MTTRNEEILKAAHELEYPENVPYFVNGAEWADKHPSKESLKERYTWKPSEEQMDALHDAAVYIDKSMFPYPKGILMKLYEQLKKLREE